MLELFADVHGLAATGPADEALVDGIRTTSKESRGGGLLPSRH